MQHSRRVETFFADLVDEPFESEQLVFSPETQEPLRLGRMIVGWLPSDFTPLSNRAGTVLGVSSSGATAVVEIKKMMEFDFGGETHSALMSLSDLWVLRGGGDVIVSLPESVFSSDSPTSTITYSHKTSRAIYAALTNYYTLLKQHIQRVINEQPSELDVMKTLAKFYDYYQTRGILHSLTWRGIELGKVLQDSKAFYLYTTFSGPLHHGRNFTKDNEPLIELMLCQIYSVETESQDGLSLFEKPLYITFEDSSQLEEAKLRVHEWHRRLEERTEVKQRHPIFIFGSPDDPIHNWVFGKTISAKEFRMSESESEVG